MLSIGIDLGGTNIKSALIDSEKGILEQFSTPTEPDKGREHVLGRIAEVIKEVAEKAPEKTVGIGVGAPGVISLDRTSISNPPNLKGWDCVNLADEMKKRTGLECRVENDANVAALGSARFGIGKNYEHFIMVTLGTGVGGGIIFNNQIFRGATGGAGELGHVIIDYHGPISNSPTRGGIEGYIGQRFLSRYASDVLRNEPDNPLTKRFEQNWDAFEPKHLTMAAEKGNETAVAILKSAGEKLGYAIVNYVHMMDIRTIVVSGGVSRAGDWILEPARKMALERLMIPFRKGFEILFEPKGNDISLLGAGSLALDLLQETKA
jgi:glucokinase